MREQSQFFLRRWRASLRRFFDGFGVDRLDLRVIIYTAGNINACLFETVTQSSGSAERSTPRITVRSVPDEFLDRTLQGMLVLSNFRT